MRVCHAQATCSCGCRFCKNFISDSVPLLLCIFQFDEVCSYSVVEALGPIVLSGPPGSIIAAGDFNQIEPRWTSKTAEAANGTATLVDLAMRKPGSFVEGRTYVACVLSGQLTFIPDQQVPHAHRAQWSSPHPEPPCHHVPHWTDCTSVW